MLIDDLFERLRVRDEANSLVSYGKQLHVSEGQVRILIALSHLLPNKLTGAIELIENGQCHCYLYEDMKLLRVDGLPVSLRLWCCPCEEYIQQALSNMEQTERWKRVCKHILAAYIVAEEIPMLDYASVSITQLSSYSEMALALKATLSIDAEMLQAKSRLKP